MSRDLLLNLALKRAGRDGQGEKGSKRGERWGISGGSELRNIGYGEECREEWRIVREVRSKQKRRKTVLRHVEMEAKVENRH